MRKLALVVLAVLFIVSTAFAVGDSVTVSIGDTKGVKPGQHSSPGIGDIGGQGKYISDPHRTFRLVRYLPASSSDFDLIISKDTLVIWDTGVSGDDGVTVTRSTVSVDSRVAGILAVNTLPPISTDASSTAVLDRGKRNWTWLQTYGKAELFWEDSVSGAAGDAFGTSSTIGAASTYPSASSAEFSSISAEPASQGYAGFLYDAATKGTGDIECFLKL